MIKIIFSDMDGTLLDDNGNLPPGFDDTIKKLKSRGVIFTPASGRQYFSLLKSFGKYKNDFMFVAENGTLVMHKDKEIFSSPMGQEMALKILKTGEDFPDIVRVYCGKKKAYFLKTQTSVEVHNEIEKYFTTNTFVDNFDQIDDVPIKMSFFDKTGKAAQTIYPILKERFGKEMQVVLASDYWTDLINLNVSKGVAVKHIQKMLNIKPDECAAFGDYLNDTQMLQAVTYSFAMANAHPELKKFAKYETTTNTEYGVLTGINRLIDEGLI